MTGIAASEPWNEAALSHDILGVEVRDVTRAAALAALHADIASGTHRRIAFLNAHGANLAASDPAFRAVLERCIVLPDGIGVDIAAWVLHGRRFLANLNGTDFVPALLAAAPAPLKVGLYGAKPGIAERAAVGLAALDARHDYRAMAHGYVGADAQRALLAALSEWKPDILLVALGAPGQETWIARHITQHHCTLAIGVGALFDFASGMVPRAPAWVRRLRMEWVHRLAREPGRLWRRYLLGNPVFLVRLLRRKAGFGATGARGGA